MPHAPVCWLQPGQPFICGCAHPPTQYATTRERKAVNSLPVPDTHFQVAAKGRQCNLHPFSIHVRRARTFSREWQWPSLL